MNPIANLPATQNLNKAQQSQGYNRQYFGGDEVDEVVLSNQEEQKKKKAWTIGLTTLGTIALAVGAFVGLSATGCTKKGADNLKGFTQLTQGEGESATKLATIAKTDKSWTGATWGGVAETIKTTLDDSKTFGTIVIVATKENQKKLTDKLGTDFINKHHGKLIFKEEGDIENVAKAYGKDEKNLILVDSSKDNWFDEIEKAITSSNKPKGATTGGAAEEKKDTPTSATGEVSKETKSTSVPKTKQYYDLELNNDENAQKIFERLQKDMQEASKSPVTLDTAKLNTEDAKPDEIISEFTTVFKEQHEKALEFEQTADALNTYYANKIKELEQKNAELEQENEKLDKGPNSPESNKQKIDEIDKEIEDNKTKISELEKKYIDVINTDFYKTYNKNINSMVNICWASNQSINTNPYQNDIIAKIIKVKETIQSNIEGIQGTLDEKNKQLSTLKERQKEKQEGDNDFSSDIKELEKAIATNKSNLKTEQDKLRNEQSSLDNTREALKPLFAILNTINDEIKSREQRQNAQDAKYEFEDSISDNPDTSPRLLTPFALAPRPNNYGGGPQEEDDEESHASNNAE